MNKLTTGIGIVVLAVTLGVVYWYRFSQTPALEIVAPASKDDLIVVYTPLTNTTIESPLTISGKARGNWYFEASFPVKLYDDNGNLLGIMPMQAEGEWMTQDYVSFSASLIFTSPATLTGVLVLEKSNASGLPEHANELRIPVKFQASAVIAQNSIRGCYVATLGKDVYRLTVLSQQGDSFKGTLSFKNFEKDSSSGTFNGSYTDGILLGEYAFQSEGTYSVMQVVFKKSGDDFVRGYGETKEEGTRFVDTNAITYDSSPVFEASTECATPHLLG